MTHIHPRKPYPYLRIWIPARCRIRATPPKAVGPTAGGLQIITLSRRTIITEVVLHIIVPARPLCAVSQTQVARRGRNLPELLILEYFAGNFFVFYILQRNPPCNLKKTRILRPKYGWG